MQPVHAQEAPAEANARPKVLRRPAHFSGSPALSLPPVEDIPKIIVPTAKLPVPAAPAPPLWQEDGRFGAWMVLILIVANLGVALLLAQLVPATQQQSEPSLTVRNSTTLQSPTRASLPSGVTLYFEHPSEMDP